MPSKAPVIDSQAKRLARAAAIPKRPSVRRRAGLVAASVSAAIVGIVGNHVILLWLPVIALGAALHRARLRRRAEPLVPYTTAAVECFGAAHAHTLVELWRAMARAKPSPPNVLRVWGRVIRIAAEHDDCRDGHLFACSHRPVLVNLAPAAGWPVPFAELVAELHSEGAVARA
jgi:hypothetical protein